MTAPLVKAVEFLREFGLFDVVLPFLLIFSVVFAIRFGKKSNEVNLLKSRLSSIEKETASLKKLQNRIKVVEEVNKNQLAAIESLANIIPLIKGSMRLSSFSFDTNNTIEITGHAGTFKDVLEFMKKLQKMHFFENVKSEYITQKKLQGKDVFAFKIILNYIPEKIKDKINET